MDHKQSANKKKNVESDSAASSGGQGNPWSSLEAALSISAFLFLHYTLFS
jgi:hypothetical protein